MKLSKRDREVLSNFAQIRNSIVLTDKTWISMDRPTHLNPTMFGYYEFINDDQFNDIGVPDITKLMRLLQNIGEDVEIENFGSYAKLTKDKSVVRYNTTTKTIIEGTNEIPDVRTILIDDMMTFIFKMDANVYSSIKKIGKIIDADRIYFINDLGKLKLVIGNDEFDKNQNQYEIEIPKENVEKNQLTEIDFSKIEGPKRRELLDEIDEHVDSFSFENMIFIDKIDYRVSFKSKSRNKGLFQFSSKEHGIDYFVSKNSKD